MSNVSRARALVNAGSTANRQEIGSGPRDARVIDVDYLEVRDANGIRVRLGVRSRRRADSEPQRAVRRRDGYRPRRHRHSERADLPGYRCGQRVGSHDARRASNARRVGDRHRSGIRSPGRRAGRHGADSRHQRRRAARWAVRPDPRTPCADASRGSRATVAGRWPVVSTLGDGWRSATSAPGCPARSRRRAPSMRRSSSASSESA